MGDPMVAAAIDEYLNRGVTAVDALAQAGAALAARVEALADPVLRGRAADLRDVCDGIAQHLEGNTPPVLPAIGGVVCAPDLSPAQVMQLAAGRPLAFVLEGGVETSHAAILMRAIGAPAVIGVARVMSLVRDGDMLLVDGTCGQVVVDPEPAACPAFGGTARVASVECDPRPAQTRDGVPVSVTATIAGPQDARRAMAAGADGIGLFRTEWLFLRHDGLPSEDEQVAVYSEIAGLAGDRPLTVRLLDLGGDKRPPALRLPPEPNPALGLRGVRLAFAHPELLHTQCRALARAFIGRRIRLLLPMVNDPGDVARVRELLREAGPGEIADRFQIGVMIETPAAAVMAHELAAVTDFLSFGTNDLTQYVLAADRETREPTPYQPQHPAVLRLLGGAAAAASRSGTSLSACGEVAGSARMAPFFIGLGVTELSVAPDAIARTKELVRGVSREEARALGEELMALWTTAAVDARLAGAPPAGDEDRCTRAV